MYWYPIYAFYRDDAKNHHDAQDLTQGLFQDLLERKNLTEFNAEDGNFRAYLRKAAKNFAMNKSRETKAQKRGGGEMPVPIDKKIADRLYLKDKMGGDAPDRTYDKRWARALLDRVLDQLKTEFTKKGNARKFTILAPFLEPNVRDAPISKPAKALGISESAVRVELHRMRGRYGKLLKLRISKIVDSTADIEEEVRYLYDLLGGKPDQFFNP